MASDNGGKKPNQNDGLASLLKSMGGADDCDRPACDDTKSALTAALQRVGVGRSSGVGKDESKNEGGARRRKQAVDARGVSAPDGYKACPPSRDEIGASTWTLLHSMVSWSRTCTNVRCAWQ